MDTERHPIGAVGREAGLSPRMLRYLEEHGVVAPDRGPHGTGHRHYPPPEARIARAAAEAMGEGVAVATLRALRELAAARVRSAHDAGPLAWFELVALAREIELVARSEEPAPTPTPGPPPRPPGPPRGEATERAASGGHEAGAPSADEG